VWSISSLELKNAKHFEYDDDNDNDSDDVEDVPVHGSCITRRCRRRQAKIVAGLDYVSESLNLMAARYPRPVHGDTDEVGSKYSRCSNWWQCKEFPGFQHQWQNRLRPAPDRWTVGLKGVQLLSPQMAYCLRTFCAGFAMLRSLFFRASPK